MAQINIKRFLYGIISGFVIIIASGFILITLFIAWKIPFNNYKLEVFQKKFERSITKFHPKDSKLLAEVAEVGNWADGTYCEFIAGQFRSSSLSKEELEKIYPYDFFSAGVYFVDDINNNNLPYNPWSEWGKKYLKNYKPKENENVYLVWASKQGNSDGDIRCD